MGCARPRTPRRWRLFATVAAVLGCAVVLAGCANSTTRPRTQPAITTPARSTPPAPSATGSNTSATGEQPPTQVRTFAPYDAAGTLTASATGAPRSGSCWTGSIAVPAAGAYRCLAQNQILDPCYAPPGVTHPRTVACFADPWHPATLLSLATPPPASAVQSAGSSPRPWALVLANGARCVVVTGTVPALDGVALDYACGPGKSAGMVSGAGPAVTVAYGPPQGPLHDVAVTVEWRA